MSPSSQRRWSLVEKPPRLRPSACPSCPLRACRMLVGADRGAVQHLQALFGRAAPSQGSEDRLEHAQVAPAGEPAPDRVPLPVPLRNGTPAGALAGPPQDAVEEPPCR